MKLSSLLCLLNNEISARLYPQILSVNDEDTLRFWNFVIISPYDSAANFWFGLTPVSIALSSYFLKNLPIVEASSLWYPSYFGLLFFTRM